MSWNRSKLSAVVLYLALIVVSMVPSLASAEDKAGKFTLSQSVHWGSAVLVPGDYTCTVENRGPAKVIFVRGIAGKPSYLFTAQSVSETPYSPESHLTLAVPRAARVEEASSRNRQDDDCRANPSHFVAAHRSCHARHRRPGRGRWRHDRCQ